MIAALQSKGASKMSSNTGNSSSKGSTHGKVPSSQHQRNEFLSTQQTKNQYSSASINYSTNRSGQPKKSASDEQRQIIGIASQNASSMAALNYRVTGKEAGGHGTIIASSSAVHLSANKRHGGNTSSNNNRQK